MSGGIRVVFMGTPDFAVPTLRALIEDPRFTVLGAVTQPDKPRGRGRKLAPPPVKALALEHGLPVLQPQKAREPENVAALQELAPDYLVVVAYGQILPRSILDIPAIAPVNLHASLLPRWRGAAPIHRAILEGDAKTGVCAMLMEEGLDTGDVLRCRDTAITKDDTTGTLHDRLAAIGAKLMTDTLPEFKDGAITPIKQDGTRATYAKKLDKAEFVVDWRRTADEVSRKIRGLSPFPGAVSSLKGESVKILFATQCDTGGQNGSPGDIIRVSADGMEVACGAGTVVITEIKPEGKKSMGAHAYVIGRDIGPGDTFG